RDHDDGRVRQCSAQPHELPERIRDGRIGWPHRMKYIAGNDDEVRLGSNDAVQRAAKCLCDIALARIDATRAQAVVCAKTEVQIGEVRYAHGVLLIRILRYLDGWALEKVVPAKRDHIARH